MKIIKTVKRASVFFVICLAVFGAYTLLRKPPQLNISTEDRDYLQKIGIAATEEASDEGLSGVHGVAAGVPSLVLSNLPSDSAVPSGLLGIPSEVSPPFLSSYPAVATDAPTFAPLASNTVPAAAPASVAVPVGSPPATPVPAVSPPAAPPLSESEQQQQPLFPNPVDSSVSPAVPFIPPSPPPPPQVSPPPPVSWDGTAADVYIISSSASSETAGDVAVMETKAETVKVNPPKTVLSAEEKILKRLPVIEETTSKVKFLSSPQPNNVLNDPEVKDNEVVAVSKDNSKENPQPAVSPAAETKSFPMSLPQEPIIVSVANSPPVVSDTQQYRQTSIRKSYKDNKNTGGSDNETQPIVSFGQQILVSKDPVPLPMTQKTADGVAVMPFSESDSVVVNTKKEEKIFAEPVIKNPSFDSPLPGVRDSVEKMVKSQEVIIDSGDAEKIREAFIQLSKIYNEHSELSSAERSRILPILDRLTLDVIYSHNSHILEPAYTVKTGDTPDSIAKEFDLSAAILMKINGLTGARPLEPGTKLKTIVGPFDAKISIQRRELTLILGGLYAGRFTVALGERVEKLRGEFYVNIKTETWDEKVLTLNNGVTFRGLDRHQPSDSLATVVRFTQQDAKELFDILSEHSVVVFED